MYQHYLLSHQTITLDKGKYARINLQIQNQNKQTNQNFYIKTLHGAIISFISVIDFPIAKSIPLYKMQFKKYAHAVTVIFRICSAAYCFWYTRLFVWIMNWSVSISVLVKTMWYNLCCIMHIFFFWIKLVYTTDFSFLNSYHYHTTV